MEEKLISDLIERIAQELPFYKVSKRGQQQAQALMKQNEQALIDLSTNQINIIISGLLQQLEKLVKIQSSSEENMVRLASSQCYLLDLLQRSLEFPWVHIKAQFENIKDQNLQDLDQGELIRLKERMEGVLPPGVDEDVCIRLYNVLTYFLTAKSLPHMQAELQETASKCLFQLSASNYENIIPSMVGAIQQSNVEEDILVHIGLLKYLNTNRKQLAELFKRLEKVISGYVKKSNILVAFAKVIRTIIWNWIDRYPIEFVNLCKSEAKLEGVPDVLFEIFESAASNTAKKVSFWPVCTMLLILCPDIMLKVVLGKETGVKSSTNKAKFLEQLRKSLSSSKLGDVAAVCYVDICKASTYVSKFDTSALRYIVTAIEGELSEKLFNFSLVLKPDGVVDEQLLIDYLLSAFYLSPRKVMNSLFADCVKTSSPPLFKRILVKALLQIACEQNLPWNPSINDIYSIHASHLRGLFQEFLASTREYGNVKNTSDKKGKAQLDKVLNDIHSLTKLIALYKVDPVLALFPLKTASQDLEDIRSLLTGLCDCVAQFDLPELSSIASQALLVLHEPQNIERWCPKQGIEGFWNVSSSVNTCLASIIVDRIDLDQKSIHNMITLLEGILSYRVQFLERSPNIQPDAASKNFRLLASTKLESAFLLHLGSSSTEIVTKCSNSFRLICTEIELLRNYIDENDNSIVANYDAYKHVADISDSHTGRQAQQKAIRKILRGVERQTAGNFAAWDELCYRWHIYTSTVRANEELALANQSGATPRRDDTKKKKTQAHTVQGVDGIQKLLSSKSSGDVLYEWTNFLGVLCSLAAVTIPQGSNGGRGIGARAPKVCNSSGPDEFLSELMSLLVSDFVSIRETVKLMLGTALSPAAYSSLFKILQTQAKQQLFGDSDQAVLTNEAILFVDQIISILKLILENEISAEDLSLLTDFEDIILISMRFVHQLTISPTSLQIRHKMCALLETVMNHGNVLPFRNEFQFRTDLAENLIAWTSEFLTKQSNIPADLPPATLRQVNKLIKELDAQALKSISVLIRGLPLQGKDDEAISNLFSRLFTFLTNLLTRCKKSPDTVLTNQLPESTIQALSYLVTANIEHGLEYFVTMGYHGDYETRSAFLKVLTNILKERSDFDSDAGADKYYKLLELILDPDLEVVLTLCDVTQVTEADQVAQLLVRIFEANEKTLDLLKASINAEVSTTDTANTLFRRNSMATKLLAAYCKLIGRDYLQAALGPQLKALVQNPLPSELNPSKLPEGQNLQENQKNVLLLSERFQSDIESSLPKCPAPFRELCKFLRDVVVEKFPGAEHTAIAGFMYLRYLCPAIVAPDGYGVIDTTLSDPELRRALIMVTKVLQNLANRVLFTKEPFMDCMNNFIETRLGSIRDLFDRFAEVSEDDPPAPVINFSDEQREEDLARLHYFLSMSMEKIKQTWSNPEFKGKTSLDRLTSLLSQLGPPPELPSASKNVQVKTSVPGSSSAKANLHFEKFMARMAGKNVDHLKSQEIFYQHGKTKKGHPVFYYIAKNYRSSGQDDLLSYYMLQTAQGCFAKPYSLVVDLSGFSPEHQLPPSTCTTLSKILPLIAGQNLDAVYLINTNQWFRKYSKNLAKFVSRIMKRFVFLPKPSGLFDYIAEDQCRLPASTLTLEKSVQSIFSPATQITQMNKKEVRIIICTEALQIVTLKPQPVFSHPVSLVTIIPVSKIGDIVPYKDNNFIVKYENAGQRSLELFSPQSGQILQQIAGMKDRFKLSQPACPLVRSKAFRPADVPGTLLNMAFLNLTVDNHELRISAYNLLVSLFNTFSFKFTANLLEAGEISIPKNSGPFVRRVSAELAKLEPGMCLEFLQQSIDGIGRADTSSQVLVLEYLQPWVRNLGMLYLGDSSTPEERTPKIEHIFASLIALSLQHGKEIGPAILSKVWKTLGKCPQIIDMIVEYLLKEVSLRGQEASLVGTPVIDIFEDIITTLASENAQLLSGKIIFKFIAALEETHTPSVGRIEQHPHWRKFEVMIRWLMILSYENLVCVERYLPELFHIIMMTCFSGDSLIRADIYSLLINIVHSLLTKNICLEEKKQGLKFFLNEFQQLQFQLYFGVGGGKSDYSPFQRLNERDEKLEVMPMSMVENVAGALFNVLNSLYEGPFCIGTDRHVRWLSLASRCAFATNTCLQPRAIITMGTLCQSPLYTTENLIISLLRLLRETLASASGNGAKIDELPAAIISCLSKMFLQLDSDSKFYDQFFWVAMSLCQIHDQKLFLSCVQFLEHIVKTLYYRGAFKGTGLNAYCMRARKAMSCEPMMDKLDQITGFSFKTNFSFAMGGHLLKGLKTGSTKASTFSLILTIIDHSLESNLSNLLGFLAAVLPLVGDNIPQSIRQLLLSCTETGQSLFQPALVPDKIHAALLFSMLATMLKSTDLEHEQLYIYRTIEEGAHFMPDSLPVTYDVLIKKMEQVLSSNQNVEILASVMNILQSIYDYGLESTAVTATLTQQYLDTVGFSGIAESDQFHSSQKSALIQVVCNVLDSVLVS